MAVEIEELREVMNTVTGACLRALESEPIYVKAKSIGLFLREVPRTELPVVISRRLTGDPEIWLTVSFDLHSALHIADKSLKASGAYAMGFSEREQKILKDLFNQIVKAYTTLFGMKQDLPGSSEAILTFGRKVNTRPSGWNLPLVAELRIPDGRLQLDVSLHQPLALAVSSGAGILPGVGDS